MSTATEQSIHSSLASFTTYFGYGILFGTLNTLLVKIMLQTTSVGSDGKVGSFEKPWLLTWFTFAGMLLALPLYLILKEKQSREVAIRSSVNDAEPKPKSFKTWFLLAVPAILDVLNASLSRMGLALIPASLYQTFRGLAWCLQ